MTRQADVLRVAALLDQGISQAEAARRSGVPQRTVNKGARAGIGRVAARGAAGEEPGGHCHDVERLPSEPYAYLLGLYRGDGCLAEYPRGVYRLHITMCTEYPNIIAECRAAMGRVLPNKVGQINRKGCVDVVSYSKHWPCLFPQHGPDRKHTRPIRLEHWQESIALEQHPRLLLRGLIHSDAGGPSTGSTAVTVPVLEPIRRHPGHLPGGLRESRCQGHPEWALAHVGVPSFGRRLHGHTFIGTKS